MTTRRWLAALVVLPLLVFTAAACSSNDDNSPPSQEDRDSFIQDVQDRLNNLNQDVEDYGRKVQSGEGRQDELDGITVEFGDLGEREWWWFNVRASNTEPLLRLNLEADTAALRDSMRARVEQILDAHPVASSH